MGLLSSFALVVSTILVIFGVTAILIVGMIAYNKIVEAGGLAGITVPGDLYSLVLGVAPLALALTVVIVFLHILLVEVRRMIVEEEVL